MKKFLLALSLLLPLFAGAQTIPNGGFETWVRDSLNFFDPTAQIPAGWQGTSFGGTIAKGSGGRSGAFHLSLKEGNFMGTPFPGAIVTQVPATTNSRYLNGYIRKPAGAADTASISAIYLNDGVGVGGGAGQTNALFANWTAFSIEIAMQGGAQVDSFAISMLVQGSGPGYQFDDFTFSNTPNPLILGDLSSVRNRKSGSLSATLAPNPVAGDKAMLNLTQLSGSLVTARVVDVLGNTVWSIRQPVSGPTAGIFIQTGTLSKGIYHIVVENGGRRSVVQFVKN